LAHGGEDLVGSLAGLVDIFEGDMAGLAEGFDGEVADSDEALADGLGDGDVANFVEDDVALGFGEEAIFEAEDAVLEGKAAGVEADVLHGSPEVEGERDGEEGPEFGGLEGAGLQEDDDADEEEGAEDVPEDDALNGWADDEIGHVISLGAGGCG
jgi:hypothetical protein